MRNSIIKLLGCPALITLSVSCANLSHINSFSDASSETLNNYQEISFSASQYCKEIYCLDASSYTTGIIIQKTTCDCKEYINADKAIGTINKSLSGYFEGLRKLSDKDGKNLSFDNLGSSASTLSADLKLGLKDDEVKAAKDLSSQFSVLLLSTWKRKKLKRIVSQSNSSVVLVVDAQKRNIVFLRNILREERLEIQAAYGAMADKTSETPLKFLINTERVRRDSALLKQDRLLTNFSSSLEKIKEGHQELYDKRETLKGVAFVKSLKEYTSGLGDLYKDFRELKK